MVTLMMSFPFFPGYRVISRHIHVFIIQMDRWKGRCALVTGASLGIGAAISSALVQHGMNVIGCARNMEKLKEFAATIKGLLFLGHLNLLK